MVVLPAAAAGSEFGSGNGGSRRPVVALQELSVHHVRRGIPAQ